MSLPNLPGLILKAQSGFFTVRTEAGDFVCHLRGKLKQQRQATDLAAVGDRVTISVQADGQGMIENVAPRRATLSRRAPVGRHHAETEQVLVANVDQLVLVFACANPAPHPRMLDRFLVIAEAMHLPVVICANKTDLVAAETAQSLFGVYPPIGYRVLYTSAATAAGLAELHATLQNKISVFTGPSGVGKSSLLNAIQPGLGLKAKTISASTSKGRHTTSYAELFELAPSTYVADTPGLRALGLWDIEPEELDGYFVEFRARVENCGFSDCTHQHEPNCAVRQAVATGEISPSRYESYCRLRAGEF